MAPNMEVPPSMIGDLVTVIWDKPVGETDPGGVQITSGHLLSSGMSVAELISAGSPIVLSPTLDFEHHYAPAGFETAIQPVDVLWFSSHPFVWSALMEWMEKWIREHRPPSSSPSPPPETPLGEQIKGDYP